MSARAVALTFIAVGWSTVCAATAAPTLSLGGIAIGSSVADAEKRLGFPNVAQTTDFGTFWQWADHDGLDREVYTDDHLIVESVVIAPAKAGSTAQPSEAPMLGLDVAAAESAASTAGAGPLVTKPKRPNDLVWPLGAGYLAAETDGSTVRRVRALDEDTARRWGYAGAALATPPHTAVAIVHEVVVHPLPSGRGSDFILVTVDPAGKVTDAQVVVGSGDSEVDAWSIRCARFSQFKAATCAGAPCAGTYLFSGGIED